VPPGLAFLERKLLRADRDPEVSEDAAARQREAIGNYTAGGESVQDHLKDICLPTLIVQGSNDVIIPTMNSYVLQQKLPNAVLILYPDSNHGSFYHYPDLFVKHATLFLDAQSADCARRSTGHERNPAMTTLSGKTALVTGASRGIGRATPWRSPEPAPRC
jgi:hypothetical protein